MLLRLLREPRTGRPGPAARLIALLVVLGLLAVAGPMLLIGVGYLWSLLT